MDSPADRVKWLETLETQVSYLRSFAEALMEEQEGERTLKALGMVRWVGRSPVAII